MSDTPKTSVRQDVAVIATLMAIFGVIGMSHGMSVWFFPSVIVVCTALLAAQSRRRRHSP